MKANQNRLSILSQSEIQNYFGIPRLTQEDREYYFELADNEVNLIDDNWGAESIPTIYPNIEFKGDLLSDYLIR